MYYRSMPYFDPEEVARLLASPPVAKSRGWRNWFRVVASLVLAPSAARHGDWL
jgi:hypothetical protein